MKKVTIFLFFLSIQTYFFAQNLDFGGDKAPPGLKGLKEVTHADRIQRNITALFGKIFSKENVLEHPLTATQRAEWLAGLRLLSQYMDINSKAKSDKDIFKAYKQIVDAANQIVDLQPKIALAVKQRSTAQINQLTQPIDGFIKNMTNVTNTYETLSKKITSKLWSSEKKEAWKLINSFAEFVKAAYQQISKNIK